MVAFGEMADQPNAWPKSNSNAILAIVFGVLSFFGGSILTGIPAWILGRTALSDIDAGRANPNDRTIAKVGLVLGQISVGLFVVGFCFVLMYLSVVAGWLTQASQQAVPTPGGPPIERGK